MTRLLIGLAALALGFFAPVVRADISIDDPSHLLFGNETDQAFARTKLAAMARFDGIKVVLQAHLTGPSDQEDKVDGAYMTALSTRLGLVQHGVLMVYFAQEKDWRVWIGNELTPTFAGRAASVQELTDSGQMHKAKTAYLLKAKLLADGEFRTRHGASPKAAEQQGPEYLGLQALMLIDGLHEKLGPGRAR